MSPSVDQDMSCDICGRSESEGAVLALVWTPDGTYRRCDLRDGRRSNAHWRRIRAGRRGRLGPSADDLRVSELFGR
jgi:hypothetical protein